MSSEVKFSFNGKKALVTGAGRGIGRGIAIALATSGAETFALSKTKENLDSLVAEYPSIHAVCVDLADWSATRKAVKEIGPIDLLVNNAAVGGREDFFDAVPATIDRVFDINVKAVINVSQVVAEGMRERKNGGSIVNISSQGSVRATAGLSVYCTLKGALDQLTRQMALELGPHQIRVNSVNPTVVLTDMGHKNWDDEAVGGPLKARIPLGRFAEVSEVVDPVLFLLSDGASMVNGTILMVDGGFCVA